MGSFSIEPFGLRGRTRVNLLKRVADRGTKNWSKTTKTDRMRTSEKEMGHLLLQNRSQKVWERHGMVLGPKIPYQILKNIDFGVSGVGGGSRGVCGPIFLRYGVSYFLR